MERDPRLDPQPGDEVSVQVRGNRTTTWTVWYRVTGRTNSGVELDGRTETHPWAQTGWSNLDWWRDRARDGVIIASALPEGA